MNKTRERRKTPKILLYGTFSDLFLEGVSDLGYDVKLSNLSNFKNLKGEFDIVLFGWDCESKSVLEVLNLVPAVPVVMKGVKGLVDYVPQKERGNCFKYKKNSPFHQIEALIKTVECYKYPYDWKNVYLASRDAIKHLV